MIRRAGVDDAAGVAEVYLRSRAASVPAIPAPVHTDDDVRGWFASIVLVEREVWVATLPAGEIVALLVVDGDWVDQLYVDPDRVGGGIGTQLLGHAKAERPGGLQLWAFEANTGARRFYERHGFVAVERTDGDNEEGAPDVRYTWSGTVDPQA